MGLSLPKSNLIFLKKCLDKWVHFNGSDDKAVPHFIVFQASSGKTADDLLIVISHNPLPPVILPSSMRITRSASCAMESLCVIITIVC